MQIKYDFYCYYYDRNFVQQFMDFSQPLITAVNRPAVEISIKVMGQFGLIYASDKATFHTPFMELGHSPEGCSSFMFPRIMGPAKVHWLASNFCWKLCITWVKEHISSYCHNLWNYTTNSSPSLVQWILLSGCKLIAVEEKDYGLVMDVFPHDKFIEEVQNWVQAMAKLPPQR